MGSAPPTLTLNGRVVKMERILQVAVLATLTCVVFGQEDFCVSPTGVDGKCVLVKDCEKIKNLIRGSSSDREILKQWHCGFKGEVPMVCCPTKVTTSSPLPENKCRTLEGTFGTCVALEACPGMVKKLTEHTEESTQYVLGSRCLGPARYNVCCERPIYVNEPIHTSEVCPLSSGIPEASGHCCGEDSSGGNRIIQGLQAEIDQYPWLAKIEYAVGDYGCAGSLISSQYVLTAAHCIVSTIKKSRGAKSVRLGEFDTTNSGPDCVDIGGDRVCNLGAISIPIATTIVHPDYNPDISLLAHGIALIKLSEMAPYNDFIRPICLPTSDITKSLSSYDYTRFYASGWGPVDKLRRSVKLHIVLPYVNETHCQQIYGVNDRKIPWNMVCAGDSRKDICKGDPGGPLMYYNKSKYELMGVISLDNFSCISRAAFLISVKVYDYVPWIKSIVGS